MKILGIFLPTLGAPVNQAKHRGKWASFWAAAYKGAEEIQRLGSKRITVFESVVSAERHFGQLRLASSLGKCSNRRAEICLYYSESSNKQ